MTTNPTYLGEFPVDVSTTKFAKFTPNDWALYYIQMYGGCDGSHHKDWVLDQVARILNGTPVIVTEARWDNGLSEFSINTGTPSEEYFKWVAFVKDGEDGPDTYGYSEGIPP